MRADNFSAEDLPELMRFLHKHGVKGYCAFNVLIFTSELASAEQQLRALEAAGVDAVIVQDLGLARMVKAITPKLRLRLLRGKRLDPLQMLFPHFWIHKIHRLLIVQ